MSDRILGAACVVVAAGMAWAGHGYAAPIAYEPVGPRAFPLLLAALMAAGCDQTPAATGFASTVARPDDTSGESIQAARLAARFEELGGVDGN